MAVHTYWRKGNSGEDESGHPGCGVDILNSVHADTGMEMQKRRETLESVSLRIFHFSRIHPA